MVKPAPAQAPAPGPAPAPAPAPAPNLDTVRVAYPNSNIVIFGSSQFPGDYIATVTQHLDDIRNNVPNANGFFTGMMAKGKQSRIAYGGPNSLQCDGGFAGMTKLRAAYEAYSTSASDAGRFATELTAALGRAGQNQAWLVNEVGRIGMPHWTGNTGTAPIPGFAGPGTTNTKIGGWLAGTGQCPTLDEADILMLALQPHMEAGAGSVGKVDYDPMKLATQSGGPRPPRSRSSTSCVTLTTSTAASRSAGSKVATRTWAAGCSS